MLVGKALLGARDVEALCEFELWGRLELAVLKLPGMKVLREENGGLNRRNQKHYTNQVIVNRNNYVPRLTRLARPAVPH